MRASVNVSLSSPNAAAVPVCACCGRAPHLLRGGTVETPAGRRVASAVTSFPLCHACDAHAREAEQIGLGWIVSLALTGGASLSRYERAWQRVEAMCSPECTHALAPAAPTSRGGTYAFALRNEYFAWHFGRANFGSVVAPTPALQAFLAGPPPAWGRPPPGSLRAPLPFTITTAGAALAASLVPGVALAALCWVARLALGDWFDPILLGALALGCVIVAGARLATSPPTWRVLIARAASGAAIYCGGAATAMAVDGASTLLAAVVGLWGTRLVVALARRSLRSVPLRACLAGAAVALLVAGAARVPEVERRAERGREESAERGRAVRRGDDLQHRQRLAREAARSSAEAAALRERLAAWATYAPASCEAEIEREVKARLSRFGFSERTSPTVRPSHGPIPANAPLYSVYGRFTARDRGNYVSVHAATPDLCPALPAAVVEGRAHVDNLQLGSSAEELARWKARAVSFTRALVDAPPSPDRLLPAVVAYTAFEMQTTVVGRYTGDTNLNSYRATTSIAWVRLSDGVVLAAVYGWGASSPSFRPSSASSRELERMNEGHRSEASRWAHDEMLAALRRWSLAD